MGNKRWHLLSGFFLLSMLLSTGCNRQDTLSSATDKTAQTQYTLEGKTREPSCREIIAPTAMPTVSPTPYTIVHATPSWDWKRIEPTGLKLSFEVPQDWVQVPRKTAWSSPLTTTLQIGVSTQKVANEWHPEEVLPSGARILRAESKTLQWGLAMGYTLVLSESNQSRVLPRYQYHIVASKSDIAVDLYASATTEYELDDLQASLDHAALTLLIQGETRHTVIMPTVEEHAIFEGDEKCYESKAYYSIQISPSILERRKDLRQSDLYYDNINETNRKIARFGYWIDRESTPGLGMSRYKLLHGNNIIVSNIKDVGDASVNERGDDFVLLLRVDYENTQYLIVHNNRIERIEDQWSYANPPFFWGNRLLTFSTDSTSSGSLISVKEDGNTIFTTPYNNNYCCTIESFRSYNGHWILGVQNRYYIDGKSVNTKLGYDEIFYWHLLRGRPFFYFMKDGHYGLSYDGQELPYKYDAIAHHMCCDPGMYNARYNGNMVWFHALRDGITYYVELGFFNDQNAY